MIEAFTIEPINEESAKKLLLYTVHFADSLIEGKKRKILPAPFSVVNQKGEILNTDELIWDEDKKIIYSNSFVKITTPDEIIYGNGMTANENFTDYVIKHITGTIRVKTSQLE